MIHHISIDAHNPLHVATVLAEIMRGKVYNFFVPGSYLTLPFDQYGTHIVVFKKGDVWTPGAGKDFAKVLQAIPTDFVSVHAAISVPVSQSQIEQIGMREGWRILSRKKEDASFRAVEFWVENRIMFEFLPPGFEPEYLQTMQPERIEKILGKPIQPVPI